MCQYYLEFENIFHFFGRWSNNYPKDLVLYVESDHCKKKLIYWPYGLGDICVQSSFCANGKMRQHTLNKRAWVKKTWNANPFFTQWKICELRKCMKNSIDEVLEEGFLGRIVKRFGRRRRLPVPTAHISGVHVPMV
jgi:hypothetical protein